MTFIILNKIRTPDGTILISRHLHDFVGHKDSNGEYYFIDGGTEYTRRSVNKEPYEDMTVYSDAPHKVIRESFHWGSYGKRGDEPLTYKPLKDLTADHIEAILSTQWHLSEERRQIFKNELEYRNEN